MTQRYLITFVEDLAMLLSSGTDLETALNSLLHSNTDKHFQSVLADIHQQVSEGKLLSVALAEHPDFFDSYFIGMIKSGEQTGQMTDTLTLLAKQLEKNRETKQKLLTAMVYPSILLIAMLGSLLVILGVVLPKLVLLFESNQADNSVLTNTLLSVGQFFNNWGTVTLIAITVAILLVWLNRVSLKKMALLEKLPIIRNLISEIEHSRFCNNLASLLNAGLPQLDALEVASESYRSDVYRNQSLEVIEQLKQGKQLSDSIHLLENFDPSYVQSIAASEQSGQLPDTLKRLAERMEKNFSEQSQRWVLLVEPVLILGLGAIIGLVVFAVFSSLQNLSSLPL